MQIGKADGQGTKTTRHHIPTYSCTPGDLQSGCLLAGWKDVRGFSERVINIYDSLPSKLMFAVPELFGTSAVLPVSPCPGHFTLLGPAASRFSVLWKIWLVEGTEQMN